MSKRVVKAVCILAAGLALAACGKKADDSAKNGTKISIGDVKMDSSGNKMTIQGPNGQKMEIAGDDSKGVALPAEFPCPFRDVRF